MNDSQTIFIERGFIINGIQVSTIESRRNTKAPRVPLLLQQQ
jgi:hypothetical protein